MVTRLAAKVVNYAETSKQFAEKVRDVHGTLQYCNKEVGLFS